eukprot:217228-Chlamydomonas_euryale.AAC.2
MSATHKEALAAAAEECDPVELAGMLAGAAAAAAATVEPAVAAAATAEPAAAAAAAAARQLRAASLDAEEAALEQAHASVFAPVGDSEGGGSALFTLWRDARALHRAAAASLPPADVEAAAEAVAARHAELLAAQPAAAALWRAARAMQQRACADAAAARAASSSAVAPTGVAGGGAGLAVHPPSFRIAVDGSVEVVRAPGGGATPPASASEAADRHDVADADARSGGRPGMCLSTDGAAAASACVEGLHEVADGAGNQWVDKLGAPATTPPNGDAAAAGADTAAADDAATGGGLAGTGAAAADGRASSDGVGDGTTDQAEEGDVEGGGVLEQLQALNMTYVERLAQQNLALSTLAGQHGAVTADLSELRARLGSVASEAAALREDNESLTRLLIETKMSFAQSESENMRLKQRLMRALRFEDNFNEAIDNGAAGGGVPPSPLSAGTPGGATRSPSGAPGVPPTTPAATR